MSEHTPEPWQSCLGQEITDSHEITVADVFGTTDKLREANTRRIVACVNACEGISTEALEGEIIKELLEVTKRMAEMKHNALTKREAKSVLERYFKAWPKIFSWYSKFPLLLRRDSRKNPFGVSDKSKPLNHHGREKMGEKE